MNIQTQLAIKIVNHSKIPHRETTKTFKIQTATDQPAF